jgi:hypothetical protein
MMSKVRAVLLISIFGLAICAWGRWEYSSTLRWNPLDEKPIPKSKSLANFDFWSAAGRFSIDFQLPMTEQEEAATHGLPMNSQIHCNFVFDLYSGNALMRSIKVNTLQQYGAMFSRHMDCFDGGTITISRTGHYLLKVQNLGRDSKTASGRLSLIRQGNTENAAVLSGVFYLLIWIFAGMTLLAGISCRIEHWTHKAK